MPEGPGIHEIEVPGCEESARVWIPPEGVACTAGGSVIYTADPQQNRPAPPAENDDGYLVTAPMVGTFYDAPVADARPYAPVSPVITAGVTFCIIEALTAMNKIEADGGALE